MSCPYKGTRLPPLLSATSPALLHSGVSIPVTPRFPPRLTSRRAVFLGVFFCPTPTPHQPSQPLFIRTSETAAIGCYSGNRRSVQPMGCRANRVTVTHEAVQLLCRLRPRHICISAVPSPVLAPPLHGSRLHVAPVQMAREGCFSVNGVASPTLRATLTYFHDGTRTAGAGMKPKAVRRTFANILRIQVESSWRCFASPVFKERRRKAVSPLPPNQFLFPFVCRTLIFLFFFFAPGWCQCARAAPSPHVTPAISSPRVDRRGLFTQENATSCQSRRKFENTKLQLSRRSRCVIFRLSVRPNLHH